MKFEALAKGETLELSFVGHIGDEWAPDGISYKRVSKALRDAPQATKLKIRANSFGGNSLEGHAIRALLQASGKHIEMEIDGVAASAMTVIAMAADHIAIAADAQFMIHNSRAFAGGTASQLRSDVRRSKISTTRWFTCTPAARSKASDRFANGWTLRPGLPLGRRNNTALWTRSCPRRASNHRPMLGLASGHYRKFTHGSCNSCQVQLQLPQ